MVPTIEEEEQQQQQQHLAAKAATPSRPEGASAAGPRQQSGSRTPGAAQSESQAGGGAQNYLSSLISKSSILLHALKQQYSTSTGSTSGSSTASSSRQGSGQSMQHQPLGGQANPSGQQQQTLVHQATGSEESPAHRRGPPSSQSAAGSRSGSSGDDEQRSAAAVCDVRAARSQTSGGCGAKPPLPPPPSREALRATTVAAMSPAVGAAKGAALGGGAGRRHAIQEQSLERDAALSLKARDLKHKRTSSIKSALRHANLGSLRGLPHHGGGPAEGAGSGPSAGGGGSSKIKSNPYELFEPPVTQRTFQRSRRRGAMSDPKRQMSADTIGLRQLTDEYLQNAGVKPMSSSGQCSLVALTGPLVPTVGGGGGQAVAGSVVGSVGGVPGGPLVAAGSIGGAGDECSLSGSGVGQSQFAAIETHLYQASKRALILQSQRQTGSSGTEGGTAGLGSEDSLSTVAVFPGNLPWQSDVSVQCELLQAPQAPAEPPYETTGDILNTIAGPFRSGSHLAGSLDGSGPSASANQLSATLKRGLTAISQHHLTPAGVVGVPTAATLNVVGNLKKSLSNTLDISRAGGHHLHSQDSLPAYSSLLNEPESPDRDPSSQPSGGPQSLPAPASQDQPEPSGGGGGGGLIGQLASKLGRQSSKKKFSVSRKGLQRALSFDCRGYKRLEAQQQQQQQLAAQQHQEGRQLLSTSNQQQLHNRSTMCLDVAGRGSPRPYLPQSASQVDFQLPLLPYHKMQEAIVSQRLIDPRAQQQQQQSSIDSSQTSKPEESKRQPDADELICGGQPMAKEAPLIAPQEPISQLEQAQERSQVNGATTHKGTQRTPPRLVLDIPTIATPTSGGREVAGDSQEQQQQQVNYLQPQAQHPADSAADDEEDDDDDGEEVCAANQDDDSKATVIVCLPSPNVAIDPGFNCLPNSGSFCIDPNNRQLTIGGASPGGSPNQLSANDIFSSSQSLIKRPSTMLVSDTMNQVARALNSTGSGQARPPAASGQQEQVNVVLRSRRQAIVPPKLATDASASNSDDGEPAAVGKLVDVEEPSPTGDAGGGRAKRLDADEATVRALRRKRSGGGAGERRSSTTVEAARGAPGGHGGSQAALPTFCIEQEPEAVAGLHARDPTPDEWRRPDSQATNAESIVSSGSSTNLSLASKRGEFTVTSPGGLTVSFGSTRGRRRSSIAVIPQMQICPGDLLVYSKQLIDRMNQSDETEPPQFLTIDDKKAKNIWSSFKLFDNRTLKARNELLCSLEDVLASLQPSTFVDEQLSHYKGMLWNEFLYETESRRSASSEVLSTAGAEPNPAPEDTEAQRLHVRISEPPAVGTGSHQQELAAALGSGQQQSTAGGGSSSSNGVRETLKASVSSGPAQTSPHRARDPAARSLSSRFRSKPKLKRGQTVDSVFRIPLIPSSPLKHAQQHQQTPTAHLEEHALLNEDDERSSASAASGGTLNPPDELEPGPSPVAMQRKSRSSSTRSRTGSSGGGATRRLLSAGGEQARLRGSAEAGSGQASESPAGQQQVTRAAAEQDSSFETDDAMDLIVGPGAAHQGHASPAHRTPHQIVRQSSLSTLSSTMTRTEQKRQRALWDLFQSECTFFFDHLLTLKNVYMEPLKKIQVEGFAMFADPDVLFGNLDELCCGVYDFCKEFLYIIMRTLKTRPEELNATDVLIKLYKKNPKIDHLRGVYHRYTLNYINALTYLESLRRQVEFVEFEKWSSRDVRCKKLQLTDLLVAPVQHIMRVPIILKDIESHTENPRDRDEIRAILAVEEASLRELDDKMRWLKNFERLLEIQKNISWPSVLEQDSKLFIPDFLKEVLSKQPCEKLIVSPRRQIVHEGTLSNHDCSGKACDMHVILFDDMLLLTRRKKGLTKRTSTVCKTNSGGSSIRDDGSFKYIVYKQPLSLDRFYVHDVQQVDAQSINLKHLFLLIVMNRFQQITYVHSFSAPNDDIKQTWLFKIKKTAERWKKKNFSNGSGDQPELQSNVQQPAGGQQQIGTTSQPDHQQGISQESASNQQHQYQPIAPKVVNLSAAMRQVNVVNQEQPTSNRRPLGESPLSMSPSRAPGNSHQQAQSSSSTMSNSYHTANFRTTDDYGGGSGRDSRQRSYHHYQQQQRSIELVVTSAPTSNSHESHSAAASSLAPAHY